MDVPSEGPERIIYDARQIISRIERKKQVSPVEVSNSFIPIINCITRHCAVRECGLTETIPKSFLFLAINTYIHVDRYRMSGDYSRGRIGDHNAAYHISRLRYVIETAEKLKLLLQKEGQEA